MAATYGIIGRPLGHSFSPRYFAEKFRREGIDARYEAFELRDIGEVGRLLERRPDLLGFNVTIPYKEAVMGLLDEASAEARAVGAANCVRVDRAADGSPRLAGHNTDAAAFGESLARFLGLPRAARGFGFSGGADGGGRPAGAGVSSGFSGGDGRADSGDEAGDAGDGFHTPSPLRGTPPTLGGELNSVAALVLGDGGAARAVRHALDGLGIPHLTVSRAPRRPGVIGYGDLAPEVMAAHALIVNTTPLGTWPDTAACPGIPYGLLTPQHFLYDLTYNPAETEFMRRGRLRGARVKNGLEMLRLQAEASWAFWRAADSPEGRGK